MIEERQPSTCLVCDHKLIPASRLPGLMACESCGFITADCSFTHQELATLYGPDYFHGDEYADYTLEKAALQKNFMERIANIENIYGPLKRASLFEIGVAYGFFLDAAKPFFSKVMGVDISEAATAYARDELHLDARTLDVITFEPPYQPNVICMWDVIEHLGQPDAVIQWSSQHIADDGIICLTTGNIDSANARFRGPKWRLIHPPTHLHYFSVKSITRLLDRHGFDVVHVAHPSIARSLKGILHGVLGQKDATRGLYNFLAKLMRIDVSISLNLYDIMFVVARKRASHA